MVTDAIGVATLHLLNTMAALGAPRLERGDHLEAPDGVAD
jgi:hypothetical protein